VRACSAADDPAYATLEEVTPTSQLQFRVNHRLVVLNDVANGNIWNPDESTDVIKIQWKTIETQQNEAERSNDDSTSNKHTFEKTCSTQSGQIKAVDDTFGVRAGAHQILDVLRNDEQTDCSVLRITSVSAPKNGTITVSPIYDGRYLQLDASHAGAGAVTFTYEIGDGRDQTSQGTVTLNVTGAENRAPRQTDAPNRSTWSRARATPATCSARSPTTTATRSRSSTPRSRTPTRPRSRRAPTACSRSTPGRWPRAAPPCA
jgi:hypothetical protein